MARRAFVKMKCSSLSLICVVCILILSPESAESKIFGATKPDKSEIKNSFEMSLSSYLSLSNFEVKILENLGNKVDPNWGSRFKATVRTRVDSYYLDREEADAYLVSLKTPRDAQVDVYGKAYSKVHQGGWKHTFELEGKPIENIGTPLDRFGGKRVIVAGSKEADEYIPQSMSVQQPDKQQQLVKQQQTQQLNVPKPLNKPIVENQGGGEEKNFDLEQHLLGTWAEVCGGWKGNITYYDKNRIVMNHKGKLVNGTWKVVNGAIVVQYEGDKELTWQIVEMKQNDFVIKSGQYTCTAKRSG